MALRKFFPFTTNVKNTTNSSHELENVLLISSSICPESHVEFDTYIPEKILCQKQKDTKTKGLLQLYCSNPFYFLMCID